MQLFEIANLADIGQVRDQDHQNMCRRGIDMPSIPVGMIAVSGKFRQVFGKTLDFTFRMDCWTSMSI